jgi:DNA-binding HxlR family transcriptional regulator
MSNRQSASGNRESPAPGRPVRGSATGRPIMALLDLLGRRWALRIVWELSQAPAGFRDLQARCDGMSPSVLSQRLRELTEASIIATASDGAYALTGDGRDLLPALDALNTWAKDWASRMSSNSPSPRARGEGAGG